MKYMSLVTSLALTLALAPTQGCSGKDETPSRTRDHNDDDETDEDGSGDNDDGDQDVVAGAPTLPSTSGSNYTLFFDGTSLLVYWLDASDDETAAASLEYRVTYRANLSTLAVTTDVIALDWTAAASLQKESSERYYTETATTTGAYVVWVSVRDEDGNVTNYPELYGEVPGPDTEAPTPNEDDYTVFQTSGGVLSIYWRAASDQVTATADLEYQVHCAPSGEASSVTMTWTRGDALQVEGSGRYFTQACFGAVGAYSAWVEVRDEAGNWTNYSELAGGIAPGM